MPAPAPLTDAASFRDLGYAVVEPGLDAATMDAIGEQLDALIAGLGPADRPERLIEPHVLAPQWRFWLETCRDPRVVDAVCRSLGCEELVLLMSHLIVKPAGDGLRVEWHQDNTYWPSVDGTDVVTVWLAIDDVDRENACMRVIPRSHDGYPDLEKLPTAGGDLLNVTVAVSPEMVDSAVDVVLPRGAFSIHDSFIIHGSQANHSDRRRAGYTMRYGDPATVEVDLTTHNKPVYYLRGDGSSLRPGMIDLRPGRELPRDSGAGLREDSHEPLSLHRADR